MMRKLWALVLCLCMGLAWSAPGAAAAGPEGSAGVVTDLLGRPVAGAEIEVYQLGTGLVNVLQTGRDGAFRLPDQGESFTFWQFRVWAKGYRTLQTGWFDQSRRYHSLQLEPLTGSLRVVARDGDGEPVDGRVLLLGAGGQVAGEAALDNGRYAAPELPTGDYRLIVQTADFAPVARNVTVSAEKGMTAAIALETAGFWVSGEARDAVTGAPLAGATVEVLGSDQVRILSGATSVTGRFRMAVKAPPGSYRLRVTANGYRTSLSEAVEVARGEESDWSGTRAVRVEPLTATISGTLLRQYGEPREKTRVVLHLQGYGEVAETDTTQDGTFRFEGLAAGADQMYRLTVELEGEQAVSNWAPLKAGTTNQMVLQLAPAVAGTHGNSSLSGVVTSPAGEPLAGAKVELRRRGKVEESGETDAAGAFLIKAPGSRSDRAAGDPYTVRISKAGYVTTREFTVDGQTETELHLPSNSRAVIRAIVRPVQATVQGRVLDIKGRPAAGATVSVRAESGESRSTTTTEQGWYTLNGINLRPGERYGLEARAEGYVATVGVDVTEMVSGGRGLPTVRLTPATTTFRGQVFGPGGEPLPAAAVRLYGPGGDQLAEAVTDSEGFYRINAAVPRTGLVTLSVSQDGWARTVVEVSELPAPGAAVDRDLVLFPALGSLEGRVFHEQGQPVVGAVELLEEGRGVVASTRIGEDGRYKFAEISAARSGWFWLRVRPREGSFAGTMNHREMGPLFRLVPGEAMVVDLLVR